jgi:hypothetical protein
MRIIVATLFAIAATADAYAQQLQQQQIPILIVRNASPTPNGAIMTRVFAVPSNSPGSWGNDHLGAVILGPQSVVGIFLFPGNCVYDVRVVFENGFSAERKFVNACNGDWTAVVDINGGTVSARGNYR